MARRKRRHSRRALHGFGDAFGALPVLLALPLLAKVGLVAGAGYMLLRKKSVPVVTPAVATTPEGPVAVAVVSGNTGIVPSQLRPPIRLGFTPYQDPATGTWVMSEAQQKQVNAANAAVYSK